MNATKSVRSGGFLDIAGMALSQICLVHCLLLPLILALLPGMGVQELPGGEAIHLGVLLLATPTAIYALLGAYRIHHQRQYILWGVFGLGVMWLTAALHETTHNLERFLHSVGFAGGVILAAAHLANWKARKRALSYSTHSCCQH